MRLVAKAAVYIPELQEVLSSFLLGVVNARYELRAVLWLEI